MMIDYIKREDIIKWIDDSVAQCGNRYSTDMLNMMEMFRTVVDNCLPFANVVSAELYQRALNDVVTLSVERKHGTWIDHQCEGHNKSILYAIECSACNDVFTEVDPTEKPKKYNYCPNCGARMDDE